jgi:hypothetical protein
MKTIEVGIAWFAEEQWPAYRRLMVDEVDEHYTDWKRKSDEMFERLKKEGMRVRKVPVDLSDFELWCRASRKPFDSASRASYVQHLLRTKKAEQGARANDYGCHDPWSSSTARASQGVAHLEP